MKQAALDLLKVCSRPTVPCCSTMQQECMVFEDDLIAAFNTQTTSDDASSAAALNSGINIIPLGSSTTAGEIAPPSPSSTTEGDRAPLAPSTPSHMDQLQSQRKRARGSLVHQAERMVKRSRVQHSPGNPGDN